MEEFCFLYTADSQQRRVGGGSEPRMSSLLILGCTAGKSLLSHPVIVWDEQRAREKPGVLH